MTFERICAYPPCSKPFTTPFQVVRFCCRSCGNKNRTRESKEDIQSYFNERVKRSDNPLDCWEWIGMLNDQGYGIAGVRNSHIRAHRLAYELFKGPLSRGDYILHNPHCRTRACVNPAHLRIGSQKENAADRKISGTQSLGERHYRTDFVVDDIRRIRKRYAEGALLEDIAEDYGVGTVTIHDIVKYKTWRHVDPDKRPKPRDMRYKLNDEGRAEVIRLHLSGEMTATEIAKQFNLDSTYVRFLSRRAKKSLKQS